MNSGQPASQAGKNSTYLSSGLHELADIVLDHNMEESRIKEIQMEQTTLSARTEANFQAGGRHTSPPTLIPFNFILLNLALPNPMAAVRTMMSAVREETAIITHEVAAVAKTEAIQSVKAAEGEVLNPLAVRQAVKATVQESATKSKRTLP